VGLKVFNPVTPGQRGKILLDFSEITKVAPDRKLTHGRKRISARDAVGRISVRRRGGGVKRKYRIIDFKRTKNGTALVKTIEYDPNRSANIAKICYPDGEKKYIIAPEGIRPGNQLHNGADAKSVPGNCLPIEKINVGSFIHNIELHPGKGAQLVRSAGSFAKLLGRDGKYVSIEMPSGEVRLILGKCVATVGEVGNKDFKNIASGKAGRTRWRGRRPKVRGVAMNPVDHPMGGGEGRTSGGRHPCSPTGQLAKGYKTRNKSKYSNRMILRKRK